MRIRNADRIKDLLSDLDFPASKEQIVNHARQRGADPETDKGLSALPLGDYSNLEEVLRSVPVDPAPSRTEAERVYQHRHHRKSRLAEHMRPAERPPVEDELHRDPRNR
jgi:hypothetical protein